MYTNSSPTRNSSEVVYFAPGKAILTHHKPNAAGKEALNCFRYSGVLDVLRGKANEFDIPSLRGKNDSMLFQNKTSRIQRNSSSGLCRRLLFQTRLTPFRSNPRNPQQVPWPYSCHSARHSECSKFVGRWRRGSVVIEETRWFANRRFFEYRLAVYVPEAGLRTASEHHGI